LGAPPPESYRGSSGRSASGPPAWVSLWLCNWPPSSSHGSAGAGTSARSPGPRPDPKSLHPGTEVGNLSWVEIDLLSGRRHSWAPALQLRDPRAPRIRRAARTLDIGAVFG